MTDRLDELFWSACIGCALWGVITTTVCALIVAAVVRLYCRERRDAKTPDKPGRS